MSKDNDVPQPDTDIGTSSDLEQLRDILYGNRTQVTEQRLNELESRLEAIYQELKNSLETQVTSFSDTADSQFDQTEGSINQTNTGIYQRLGLQISDLRQQLTDFRAESRQRDAELRQELLRLGKLLDKQNISQPELIDWLIALSKQSKEIHQNRTNDDRSTDLVVR